MTNLRRVQTLGRSGLEFSLVLNLVLFALLSLEHTEKPTQGQYDELERKYKVALEKAGLTDAQIKKGPPPKPPIITLTESQGYSFPSAQATISPDFEDKLVQEIIPQIVRAAKENHLDLIEVVGHTDEQPMGAKLVSSLDLTLFNFVRGYQDTRPIWIADNVGLGMARAGAVARVLLKDQRIITGEFHVVPLSAGQLAMTDGTLSNGNDGGSDASRRRIEIRLRKRGQ